MALVNSAFTVNVTPGAMPPTVHVSEYDIGRTYTVTINGQNGSAFNIPTGTTATVEGTLNGVIGFTTDATISGSTVSFTLTESMTAKSGKAWCKIKLTLNDEPIQTCAFILAVDRAGVEAETVIGASGFEQQIVDAVGNYLDDYDFTEATEPAVDNWLDDHPEATTTVQDGSLTEANFSDALKLKTIKDYATPEMFGAKGDGVTDDTTAVQSAIDYATANKYICKLGIKTYVVTKPIVIHTHTVLVGDSQFTSIIKLANDSNCDVLQTENFADLIANGGSSTKNQPFEILLSKFSVEGNRANQTTGNGISICASRVYIDSVDVRNVKDHGLWDSFIYSKIVFTEGVTTSQANWIENVRVFCCGKHGIYQYKGNDFYYNNVIVADASMDDDKSYDLLNLSGSGRLINVHPWSSSENIIPSICRYAINFNDGDYECSECHFEGGGIASVYVAVNAHVTITSTRLYASRGNYIAEIASSLNQFIGCTFAYFPGNVKAIKYANTATRNVFDCNMQLSQSDQMYFADDSESTGLNCYRIVYFGSVLASSQPAVRNLLATSSLSYVPGNMTNFQPMNIMRDLKISRLYKDLFIFDNPTDSQPIQLNDTVVVKSNSNSKSIICDFRYYKRGAEFSFYNMMSSSITVWGAYYDSDGTQQTSFTIPAKTVFKVLIVEEGDANTSPTMLTSSQVLS